MRKYILILLASFFNYSVFATVPENTFGLNTFSPLIVPPQGGTFRISLLGSDTNIYDCSDMPLTILSFTKDPQLIALSNQKGVFFFEFKKNDTGSAINRTITIVFEYEGKDDASGGIKIETAQVSLEYSQDSLSLSSFTLQGGIIECDTTRIYRRGELPPIITSKEDAVSKPYPIIIDGQTIYIAPPTGDDMSLPEITYTWEKKTSSTPLWHKIPGKTEATCQPDIIDDFIVYYRRKAKYVNDISYSNTIALKTQVNAGIISYDLSLDLKRLTIYHISDPMTPNKQLYFETSKDLKTWNKALNSTPMMLSVPDELTYYRCVLIANDGHKYISNVIYYTPIPLAPVFSQNYNFINTRTFKANHSWTDQIEYYDGLGRLSQRIDVSASPHGRDIVTPFDYDCMGRDDAITYLSYPTSSFPGEYQLEATNDIEAYYIDEFNDAIPYSQKTYDTSPLNRIISQINVGEVFRDNNKKTELSYMTNAVSDSVYRFTVNKETLTLNMSFYEPEKLHKNIIVNEDGKTTVTFVDMLDQEILKRVIGNDGKRYDTYQVKDIFGQLAWVLPPQAVKDLLADGQQSLDIENDIARNYCYIYKYDEKKRCIERKMPGKEWEFLVYDNADRIVLSQDGKLRNEKRWLFNVYDNLNRLRLTKIIEEQLPFTRQEIQQKYRSDINDLSFYENIDSKLYVPFNDDSFRPIAVLSESYYGDGSVVYFKGSLPKVVISEIFYDLPNHYDGGTGTFNDGEYIELLNADSLVADLSGWTLTGTDETKVFTFPEGTKIAAGGHLILTSTVDNALLPHYYDPVDMPSFDKEIIVQNKILLNKSGGKIILKDLEGNIKDAILAYGDYEPENHYAPKAINSDYAARPSYRSIQRKLIEFDMYGCAILNESHWVTELITPFSSTAEYLKQKNTIIPDYLNPILVDGIVDRKVIDHRNIGNKIYEKIGILNGRDLSDMKYVERAYYYDYRRRIVQTVEKNQFGGISRISNKYDFPGNIVNKSERHQFDPQSDKYDVLNISSTYDAQGRLLNEMISLNDSEPETVLYSYDELGKLKSKTIQGKIKNETIPVSEEWWLSFSHDSNEVSDLFRDFVAAKMEDYYGVEDWGQYDYIREDGSLNPDYLLMSANGTDYFYFPIIMEVDLNYFMEGILLPFQDETGMSSLCYDITNEVPEDAPLRSYIPLRKETGFTESYKYNIQGWETERNAKQSASKVFFSQLNYYDPQNSGKASYTGNITEWTWQNGAETGQNTYAFSYDELAQLEDSELYIDGVASGQYVEKELVYDHNGNITSLNRIKGDDSSNIYEYTYIGNQLSILHTDTGDFEYLYDVNGNMIKDGLHNLDLAYNYLNLIDKVEREGTTLAKYSYLADNTRISATDADGNGLYYLGSMVYKRDGNRFSLESAGFSGGRLMVTTHGIQSHYFVTDHLGSVRIVTGSDGLPIEYNNYYPFGLRWETGMISGNRYRFNGKEEQAFVNVPYTDYGARMYDPLVVRWFEQDPQAEKYQ